MKYNISDIIDFNIIDIFQEYSLITFIITVIIELFYGIIVYLTTTKAMKLFRILTFIYVFECILVELIMLCWKPFRLFPFTVLYPTGILAPMSSTISAMFAALFPFGHACFADTLAIIIVERHFLILGNATKTKKVRFLVYFSMIVSFFSMVIPYFLFIIQNIDNSKVERMLKLEVENVEQILNLQPSLYSINYHPTIWALTFGTGMWGITKVLIITFVLKENYKFVKSVQNISEKTRKQFTLMFQSTITQFITTLCFGLIAGAWGITFIFGDNNTGIKIAYYASLGILMCYPIVDVLIVLTVVKGYRNTLKKLWNAITGKVDRKISGFAFNNISVNNNNNNLINSIARRKRSMY